MTNEKFAANFTEIASSKQKTPLQQMRESAKDSILAREKDDIASSTGPHLTDCNRLEQDGLSLQPFGIFKSVSASSERSGVRTSPASSSVLGHFHPSQTSSLSASSANVVEPVVRLLSSSSTSSQITNNSGNERPGLNTEKTSATYLPRPHHRSDVKMHFRSGIKREGEFACGWGAAFINICVTFPLNKAMFRQQLHGISGVKAMSQLRRDGIRYLYRGLLPPLMQKTASLSIMFGMYYRCQDLLNERAPSLNVYANHTLAALMSGTIEAMFAPFERVQALMQTRQFHDKFANTLDAFARLSSHGVREYYRGLSLIIMRNGPSNVAFFLGREQLQLCFTHYDSGTQKMLTDFISGACLGAIISTFFFPLNVVKTRMQCKLGGHFEGFVPTFKQVWEERNRSVRGLFRGVHLNYTRSFISWGIINASFEFLMKTFFSPPFKEEATFR